MSALRKKWLPWRGRNDAQVGRAELARAAVKTVGSTSFSDAAIELLRAVNAAVSIKEADGESFQRVCEIIAAFHKGIQVRIALADNSDAPGFMRFVAAAGRSRDKLVLQLERAFATNGVPQIAQVMSLGETLVLQLENIPFLRRRFSISGQDAFCALLPIKENGMARGVLLLAAREAGLFTEAVLPLFNDIANIISMGMSLQQATIAEQETLQRLQIVTRERAVLAEVSQLMMRADSEDALIGGGCKALVSAGGYPLVWAVSDRNGMPQMRASGHDPGSKNATRPDPALRNHPLFNALHENMVATCPIAEPHILDEWLPGMTAAVRYCVTVPLWDGADPSGAFVVATTLNDPPPAFEIEFLKELARSISFGITALRSRQARLMAERKRHETTELLRNAIEGSNDFIYITDLQGRYLQFLNLAGLRRYGINHDRIVGRTPTQIWGAEVGRQATDRFHQILARDGIVQGDFTAPDVNGETRHLWVTNGPLRSEDGRLQGVFGVLRDVTDFRRAERVLRVNSKRLEVLQTLVSHDFNSENDLIRSGMAEILQLTGSNVGFFNIVEDDHLRVHMQVRRGGETIDAPFLPQAAIMRLEQTPWVDCALNGRTQVVNNSVVPFGNDSLRLTMTRFACVPVMVNNNVEVLAGVANKIDDYDEIDIQQIRLFMDSLWQLVLRRRADQQSRLLLSSNEQSMNSVLITDAAGVVTYVNHAFEQMNTISRDEILGKNFEAPELRQKMGNEICNQLQSTLRRREVHSGETIRRRVDGTVQIFEGGIYPVRNSSGTITHFTSVQRDVTAERELRQRLEQSQKLEIVGHLTGGIAHDFNNLLQVINGYAEYLLHVMPEGSPYRSEVDEIYDAGLRAAQVTSRLLAFSRKQAGQRQKTNLNPLIQDFEKILRRVIGEMIVLRTELDPDLPDSTVDVSQIEQVLLNLCVNARDAMPDGGLLVIRTETANINATEAASLKMAPGKVAVLTVEDNGVGMAPETIAQLFEPFFTTKESGKGTGLGLATVYGIITQHNGHISFESQPGAGAQCRVILPTCTEGSEAADTADADNAIDLHGNGECILIGEDEEQVRRIMAQTLTAHGYTVIEAANGAEILSMFHASKEHIDMIISDICMPIKGGLEMAEELEKYSTDTPIIFVTGYADLAEALRSGGKELNLLMKPVAAQDLLKRVKTTLAAR